MPLRGVGRTENITVSSTPVGLTSTVMSDGFRPQVAEINVEAQPLRYTVDGTTPSATVGMLALAGDSINLMDAGQIVKFRAIRSTGADATISVMMGVDYDPD